MWSMGAGLALSLQLGIPWGGSAGGVAPGNPLMGNYAAKDGKQIAFACLQPLRYWPDACVLIERPDLADDERFTSMEALGANTDVAVDILRAAFAERTAEEWRPRLDSFSGQWTFVQTTLEVAEDRQAVANGYVATCANADGEEFQLAAAPVQFGGEPAVPQRAPEFNEHGDAILEGLGLDWDAILELKLKGVVAGPPPRRVGGRTPPGSPRGGRGSRPARGRARRSPAAGPGSPRSAPARATGGSC
jgi:crotonobetainyl-CoA:carnitine CoA-transferase CaiB-like acyl-CoA transferase